MSKRIPRLSQQRLYSLLSYDEDTGVFTWLVNKGRSKVGDAAGCVSRNGYVELRIDGEHHYGHTLAWFYMTGEWELNIDHENLVRSDNRKLNLRKSSGMQNRRNLGLRKSNSTGFKGVSPYRDRYRATITVDHKQETIGYFDDPVSAAKAYDARALIAFGAFAKTNEMLGLYG